MIGIQTMINLGGITGLIPITGVTLSVYQLWRLFHDTAVFVGGGLVNVSMKTVFDAVYKKGQAIPERE